MQSKTLTALFVGLALVCIGMFSGPALSGEQPWDSDRTHGGGRAGGNGIPGSDTTVIIHDTNTQILVSGQPTSTVPTWYEVVTVVWSAMMAI
ncbi:MAG: hypothetical protein AB1772_05835 [Candidatus Zixiibacteriota bacterium]